MTIRKFENYNGQADILVDISFAASSPHWTLLWTQLPDRPLDRLWKVGLSHKFFIFVKVPVPGNSRVGMRPPAHSHEGHCKHMLGGKTVFVGWLTVTHFYTVLQCQWALSKNYKNMWILHVLGLLFCFILFVFLQNNSWSQCIKYFI